MDATPSVFTPGYTHAAVLPCDCDDGKVDDALCGRCRGKGKRIVGCGGPAERDEHYGITHCLRCGRMVDSIEVT